ncbi:26S proteasome non-ATPase regulatory subunit [Conoideocrella luteorostrata]|uniref:26S proteasome non-ATPase regulatory subunit n=1 Tax=Conoideocrella luteorostrata TaxID=1105319 RepID=A0AAJ0CPZ2_9HYPO|nr:26S proteasome non-ATPase regulatory subunit [Conoideocrella luteorostrata]
MNQGQAQQAQAQPQGQQQPRGPPMYQPAQIRSLPMLSEEEKNKYEQGLRGLWNKANNSPANSQEQNAARQKIIEFSKMLIGKIQQRRQQVQVQAQQGQQSQQGGQGGQVTARPPSAQAQQKPQQPSNASASIEGQAASTSVGAPQNQNSQVTAAAGTAAAAQRPKIPDSIMQHVNKMAFRAPGPIASKSAADVAKWVEDIKEKYARALFTMEGSKSKVASMEKILKDRNNAGKPLQDEEHRQYTLRRDQQLKLYSDAHKWVEGIRKQQESIQAAQQQAGAAAGQNGASAATPANQQTSNAPTTANTAQNTAAQAATQNVTSSVNAAVEATRNQQQLARPPPANGTSTPTPAQAQPKPVPVPQPAQQPQSQTQVKTEQPHPPPVNTVQAQAAAQSQATARVQTPQSGTPVTAGGPTRALSHSAAMTLANQRAASTPGSAPALGQQPASSAAVAVGGVNQGAVAPGAVQQQQQQQQQQQNQQGHPHAHPTQTQTGFQAKMPIPKQLPEKVTTVPQGVTLGGGVSVGRPTMSQGSGTLGGVMNQPAVTRIPAYSHDAEGDHVLSKKKLDELVRQVCGGSGDSQDGNLLTPEVEESVLNMADSFVDNVLHTACRNAKERGSKVLEIRDLQLVLERTYNIRVPGYSSDELRTVRKVQPSPGWIAKMSAVQAAKVMPGKGDP